MIRRTDHFQSRTVVVAFHINCYHQGLHNEITSIVVLLVQAYNKFLMYLQQGVCA